jgi:heme exporter protein D
MALSGSFVWLAISSVLARLVVYAMCVVVLMKAQRASLQSASLQSSMQQDTSEKDAYLKGSAGPFVSPVNLFRRLIPFVALGVCAWSIAQSSTNAWLFLLGELVVGALLYFFYFAPSNKESKG